jgi:hemerythrin-like domain-containing protein
MSQVIETLMREHRFIEQVLGSLEAFVNGLEANQNDARRYVAKYAKFFREFADRCHHGKEEDQFFKALGDHGFPRDAGPIFVMVGEHNAGRLFIKELATVGDGEGLLDQEELRKVTESAQGFISMLRVHIQKEDEILFPASERALPREVLAKMAEGFDEFERTVVGEDAHSKLHALGLSLLEDFPADTPASFLLGR